ncbi:MAG: hypothetical protein VB088_08215 [Sphaerochaeta sp.]|nr:hypothetical protein [Sphaerochaeta sp.]
MDLAAVIRPDFIVVSLLLLLLGMILKYRTKLFNKLIPSVLFAVSFVICAIWGYFTSPYAGSARWVDSLLMAGIVHGGVATSIAVWGWDTMYGLFKSGLFGKKEKKR